MVRLFLILLISCAYVGCAASRPVDGAQVDDPFAPRLGERLRGGTVRLMVGSSLDPTDAVRSNVGLPLTTAGLAESIDPAGPPAHGDGASPGCWSIRIDPSLTCPVDEPVMAAQPIAAWERAIREGDPAMLSLLSTVSGVYDLAEGRTEHAEGLQVVDGTLRICTAVATPDLRLRLADPRLWFQACGGDESRRKGPGPFREVSVGRLEPNPRAGSPGPWLDAIELVDDQDLPSILFRLGEVDLGVVLGKDVAEVRNVAGEVYRTERLLIRDRVYFLWFDVTRRWANDPRFRRWFARLVDRESMVHHLLDGHGEPAYHLSGAVEAPPDPHQPSTRPFSTTSRPRIDIGYDEGDPRAASVAARLKAVAALEGVVLELRPLPCTRPEELAGAGTALVLGFHQASSRDSVLELLETLALLPGIPEQALQGLREAARSERPDARRSGSAAVESELLSQARLVPMIRVHAWLVRHHELRGIRTDVRGLPLLGDAWWLR